MQSVKWYFPYLLVLAAIAGAMEIDLSLPSFPDIARHFAVSEDVVTGTISLNFLGFCLSALAYGPLADHFGRRPIMMVGNTFFLIGSLGCALAQSIEGILTFRFLQGLGASASFVVVFTMIADVYEGDEATAWIGRLNALLTAAMAAAPILGGFLNAYFGWRACYSFVALWTVVVFALLAMFLPETRRGSPISMKQVGRDYITLLSSSRFLQASLVPTMLAGAYLSFVSVIPFLYRDEMKMPLLEFSLHQGAIIAAFSFMSYHAQRVATYFGSERSAIVGLVITVGATSLLFLLSLRQDLMPAMIVTPLMITFAATCAIAFAVVFAASLGIFPEKNGPASSLLMSMRTLVCAGTIQFVGYIYNGTFLPAAATVAVCCLASLMLALRFYARQPTQQVA